MSTGAEVTKGSEWSWPIAIRVLVIALFAELGVAVLNISVMPVYLSRDLGFQPAVIAAVMTTFLISESVFKPLAGHLADCYGRKLFVVLGPLILISTPILTLVVPEGWGDARIFAFLALRVVDGIAVAMLWPALYALAGQMIGGKDGTQAMSLLNVCFMLGLALGLPVGGGLNDLFGSRTPSFYLASVLFAICALTAISFRAPRQEDKAMPPSSDDTKQQDGVLMYVGRIPITLIVTLTVFIGVGFPFAIIKLFAANVYGLSELHFGLLVMPAAITMAILAAPLSLYASKVGPRVAVQLGLFLCAVGLWSISSGDWFETSRHLLVIGVAGMIVGVGFLLAVPSWQAAVSSFHPSRAGAYLGVVMTAQGVGAVIGSAMGGKLYEIDPFWPFIACAIAVSVGVVVSPLAFRFELSASSADKE